MNDQRRGGHGQTSTADLDLVTAELRTRVAGIGLAINELRQETERLRSAAAARGPAIALLDHLDRREPDSWDAVVVADVAEATPAASGVDTESSPTYVPPAWPRGVAYIDTPPYVVDPAIDAALTAGSSPSAASLPTDSPVAGSSWDVPVAHAASAAIPSWDVPTADAAPAASSPWDVPVADAAPAASSPSGSSTGLAGADVPRPAWQTDPSPAVSWVPSRTGADAEPVPTTTDEIVWTLEPDAAAFVDVVEPVVDNAFVADSATVESDTDEPAVDPAFVSHDLDTDTEARSEIASSSTSPTADLPTAIVAEPMGSGDEVLTWVAPAAPTPSPTPAPTPSPAASAAPPAAPQWTPAATPIAPAAAPASSAPNGHAIADLPPAPPWSAPPVATETPVPAAVTPAAPAAAAGDVAGSGAASMPAATQNAAAPVAPVAAMLDAPAPAWEPMDAEAEAAFDRFFSAEVEPEPAQRWLLSD